MLVYIPAFQMHDMSASDAGERKSYPVVNGRDLKPRKKHRPFIGRRQNVHRTVWDLTSADRGSPGVLIPRRCSLQSLVSSLNEFSSSALCFRSCQRNRSSAYALTCITICSRHPVMRSCWTLANILRQFGPRIIPLLLPTCCYHGVQSRPQASCYSDVSPPSPLMGTLKALGAEPL